MKPVYPWSAVVGQDALKRALALCAVDPAIGGVLVQGPRGVAKTTLARALSELVPGEFVELPLGASEERVTGSLDLGAALREGQVAFSPGLLARAHRGVLYVDEVNLLPDALVDLLLDAAASGRNTVERDGVSHQHAARFVLVGTMNPDEGELRPQLLDRFGLAVDAEGAVEPAQRAEIVLRRLAFDEDAEAFRTRFAPGQEALRARIEAARERLPQIALDGDALALVTQRCHAAGVEGVRADLAMLRAARAHAAWHGRSEIEEQDVDAVEELALAHRRMHREPPPSGGSGGHGAGGPNGSGRSGERAPPESHGKHGAMQAVPVRAVPVPALPQALTPTFARARAEARRRGKAQLRGPRGARARQAQDGPVDWFATLARARPRQPLELVRRARRSPSRQLWVLALDCSASMLRGGALAGAKGVAQAFAARAQRAGAHVALIGFRGEGATLASGPREHATRRELSLAALPGGGSTPLRAALGEALALCAQREFSAPDIPKRVVLLTDGRSREAVDDLAPALSALHVTVIDCERGTVRLGRAPRLARQLGGSCLHLDQLARGA